MIRGNLFRLPLLLFVVSFITVPNAYSQDSLSLPAVQFASMVTDGKYIYIFGGEADTILSGNLLMKTSSVLLNDVSVFEANTNKWEIEVPKNGVKPEGRKYHNAVLVGNQIVVYGGKSGKSITDEIWEYDINAKIWKKVAQTGTTPPARLVSAISPAQNGFYISGGKKEDGSYINDFWFFNYQTNTWTQKASLPSDVEFDGHKAVNINDNTIALWGGDNNSKVDEVWTYNAATDTWTKNTTTGVGPQNKRGGFFMEKVGDKMYVGAGTENYMTKVNDFYSLDLSKWEWTKKANVPAKLSAVSSTVLNNKIYIYGGKDDSQIMSNKMYVYDPDTDIWSELNPLRVYPCKPPTDLHSQLSIKEGRFQVQITWNDNSQVEDGYKVERKTETGDWTEIHSTVSNVTSFSDENVTKGTTYFYKVCAFNFAGSSSYSNETTVWIEMVKVKVDEALPINFALYQNYPNPFNPETTIEFSIPSTQKVLLKIYDLLGREVTTIIDKEYPAGIHKIKFDGNDIACGVYFYTIRAGSYSDTKKLLLVR